MQENTEKNGAKEPSPPEQQPAPVPEAAADAQAVDYRDLYLRKAADFDNYRKRVQQETASLIRFANEDLMLAILPVVDDLERSLRSGSDLKDPAAFYRGIEMIRQKLLKVLESHGVTPMNAAGQEFDVAYHDALMQAPRTDVAPHTVIDVVEQGYLLHDRVLRHAKVIVSTEKPDAVETEAPSSQDRSGENEPPPPAA
jgi:molecular chaperone GrpE